MNAVDQLLEMRVYFNYKTIITNSTISISL